MQILIGFIGAMLFFAALIIGVVVGWSLHGRINKSTAKPLTQQERTEMEQQQEAFSILQNYNVERAYDMSVPLTPNDRR